MFCCVVVTPASSHITSLCRAGMDDAMTPCYGDVIFMLCRRLVMLEMCCSCSCNNMASRRWLAWNRHGSTEPTCEPVHAHASSSDLWMSTLLMSQTSSGVIFRQRFHKRLLPVRLLCLANTVMHPVSDVRSPSVWSQSKNFLQDLSHNPNETDLSLVHRKA